MNPLMQMMGGGALPRMGNIMQMVGMLRNAGDPADMLRNMAQSNPQIKQAVDMCRGKNPQEVFMQECQKKGVDPQQIINMMK